MMRGRGGFHRGGRGNFNRRGRGHFNRPNFGGNFNNERQWFNRREHNQTPGKRLTEVDLGITEYVNKDVKGFDGVIKARYSDFQVSEVDVEGKIAKLTDLSIPKPVQNKKVVVDEADLSEKYDTEIITIDIWNQLTKMDQSPDENFPPIEMNVTDLSKEARTKIHDTVSGVFGSRIVRKTVNNGDDKFIVFCKLTSNTRVDTRVRWGYPEEFVHFILHKENLDTMEAAQMIAERLNMPFVKPSFFGYAGTKDRRAKTSQWFSLRKIDPGRISKCVRSLRNVYVGNFEFKNYHLTLGYLKGNVFRIALRNITEELGVVDAAVEAFKENGFLNYYGLQRFGSRADIPTHKIGKLLLKGEFGEAIDTILTPHGAYAMQLKCYKDTKNALKALSLFPRNVVCIERKLLQAVSQKAKNDFVGILDRLPRNMRMLYLHSYQSWVWNQCLSERIRRHGFTLVVGDLVTESPDIDYDISEDYCVGGWYDNDEDTKEDDNDETEQEKEDDKSMEIIEVGRKGVNKYPKINKSPLQVKVITEEDLSTGKYTVSDLVLPLPGYSVEYPPNMLDYYEKISKEEGVDLNVKQKVKSYNLSGTYRKVLIKPQNVSWKHVQYDDPYCDLIQSDWDEVRDKKNVKHLESGKYKALILEFTLGSSTYATMALRELLKRDTSSETQAQKNDYHSNKNTINTEDTNTEEKSEECVETNLDGEDAQLKDEDLKQGEAEKRKEPLDIQENDSKRIKSE